MQHRSRKVVASLVLASAFAAWTAACGGGGSTPTETPISPTPPPSPTTAPSQARALEFTPDTLSPVGEAIALSSASRGYEAGKVTFAVSAYNLANHSTLGEPGVHGVWGRLKWDAALLVLDGLGPGGFLQQGGVEPSCCTAGEVVIQPSEGTLPFSVQRRPETATVSGHGEILLVRLRPRDGVTDGSTRIEFTTIAPPYFPEVIRLRPFPRYPVPQNIYGGTVTIR